MCEALLNEVGRFKHVTQLTLLRVSPEEPEMMGPAAANLLKILSSARGPHC